MVFHSFKQLQHQTFHLCLKTTTWRYSFLTLCCCFLSRFFFPGLNTSEFALIDFIFLVVLLADHSKCPFWFFILWICWAWHSSSTFAKSNLHILDRGSSRNCWFSSQHVRFSSLLSSSWFKWEVSDWCLVVELGWHGCRFVPGSYHVSHSWWRARFLRFWRTYSCCCYKTIHSIHRFAAFFSLLDCLLDGLPPFDLHFFFPDCLAWY